VPTDEAKQLEDRPAPDPVHGGEAERWGGWSWRAPSHGEHYRTCSYCGSIHPADLAAETDWRAEWADRKYGWPHKFYVAVPNRNPERLFITSATNATERPAGDGWLPSADVPPDVMTEGWSDLAATYTWVLTGTRATHHAKFYTLHLADPSITPYVLEAVQRVSGLRIRFEDGRVSWCPFASNTGIPTRD
jgi:hypothetical protein